MFFFDLLSAQFREERWGHCLDGCVLSMQGILPFIEPGEQ